MPIESMHIFLLQTKILRAVPLNAQASPAAPHCPFHMQLGCRKGWGAGGAAKLRMENILF